jgi:glycosyltransferase involved in cell wall biosynthesis
MNKISIKPVLTDSTGPLVSICIFNHNYGRYLRQCFESVFSQTYENVEICFSDNASTDTSWDIALEYAREYPGTMTITRNRRNFGSHANWLNCNLNVRGKYYVQLCSDDALMPEFIQQCVPALENHPDAGFAMVHRAIIDEHDNRTEELPFYNQSCLIPGGEQAAVYMFAAVNPSISQVIYKKQATQGKGSEGGFGGFWYGNRIQDFKMCTEFPMIYIKEPLLLNRMHSGNDSVRMSENLMEILGPWVLRHQFADIAANCNLSKVVDRLPQSLDKLSNLCLRYCVRFLCSNTEVTALRYFHLAIAIMPNITADPTFKKIEEYWTASPQSKINIIESLRSVENLATRNVSYDPPPGSIPLEVCL